MKNIVLASLAALALSAPAAAAEFAGPSVGATIGFADDDFAGTEVFTYGVNAGYDWDLGTTVAGISLEYQDSSKNGFGRDLSAVGRFGFKAGENALVYALAGYTNQAINVEVGNTDVNLKLDGVRVGAGIELPVATNAYGKVEYRYSNYEMGAELHQMVVGLGFRF